MTVLQNYIKRYERVHINMQLHVLSNMSAYYIHHTKFVQCYTECDWPTKTKQIYNSVMSI